MVRDSVRGTEVRSLGISGFYRWLRRVFVGSSLDVAEVAIFLRMMSMYIHGSLYVVVMPSSCRREG